MTLHYETDDLRIDKIKELLPPVAVLERYRITGSAKKTVFKARESIHNILQGDDDRLLVIVGPCSIHDTKAALEYGEKLSILREELKGDLEVVMRVYFEKPRTTVGWKGLINDPYLDHSYHLNDGIRMGRKLLLQLTDSGMPTAVEFLDMITPQYMADLISWGAIGARTTESQVHRELASGLSCSVGFKNATNGEVQVAIDAVRAAGAPHNFLSVTKYGHSAIVSTTGNEDCHIILRGGGGKPNYSAAHVAAATAQLEKSGVSKKVMIDFSHANSSKEYKKQMDVSTDVSAQIAAGNEDIFGVMIESHLVEGRQDLVVGKDPVYGQSITDACIGWEDTETSLRQLAEAVRARRNK